MITCVACLKPADDQLYTECCNNKYYYCPEHFSNEFHLITDKAKIIYVSDLHLEFYNKLKTLLNYMKFNEWPDADVLILAGDVFNLKSKNKWLKEKFKKLINLFKEKYKYVIYVAGNHEYYGCKEANISIDEADTLLKEICQTLGIIHLQKSTFTLQLPNRQIKFFGCTLWTLVSEKTFAKMNDHLATRNNNTIVNLHVEHEKWLRKELINNKDHCVVITHHVPSYKLTHSRFMNSTMNDGFSANLDHLLHYKINAWIYGHSHETVRLKINNTYCANNPAGYPDEDKVTDFGIEVLEI
jgi:predicted phosphodiesterase